MADLIKKHIPNAKIKSNSNPPRSGAFEVIINNKLVYSKLKTKEFPNNLDVQSWF